MSQHSFRLGSGRHNADERAVYLCVNCNKELPPDRDSAFCTEGCGERWASRLVALLRIERVRL